MFFFTFVHVICISISKIASQPSAAQAVQGHDLGSSQWLLFYLFPRVGASQAREFQIAMTTTPRKTVQTTFCTVICIFSTKSSKSQFFLKCVCMFLQCFPSKHGPTVIYKFVAIKPFQNIILYNVSNSPCLPKPLKPPLFALFYSIFPCSNAAGQLKHTYKKSFKTIVFFTVFLQCFPSKTP